MNDFGPSGRGGAQEQLFAVSLSLIVTSLASENQNGTRPMFYILQPQRASWQ